MSKRRSIIGGSRKQNVYVLFEITDYHHGVVRGVYSTNEKAEKVARDLRAGPMAEFCRFGVTKHRIE